MRTRQMGPVKTLAIFTFCVESLNQDEHNRAQLYVHVARRWPVAFPCLISAESTFSTASSRLHLKQQTCTPIPTSSGLGFFSQSGGHKFSRAWAHALRQRPWNLSATSTRTTLGPKHQTEMSLHLFSTRWLYTEVMAIMAGSIQLGSFFYTMINLLAIFYPIPNQSHNKSYCSRERRPSETDSIKIKTSKGFTKYSFNVIEIKKNTNRNHSLWP